MMNSLYYNSNAGAGSGHGGGHSNSPPSHQPLMITNVNAATFFEHTSPPKMPPKSRQIATSHHHQNNSMQFTTLPPATPQTLSNGVKIFKRNRLLNAVVTNQPSSINHMASSGSLMSHLGETSSIPSPLQNSHLQNA